MRGLLTASRWRERLVYSAMSLLVAWHTLAMVVAVSPDSVITGAARALVYPYVILLNLDNYWGFFAPMLGRATSSATSSRMRPDSSIYSFRPTN